MRFAITHIHSINPEDLISVARCGEPITLSKHESDNLLRGDKIRLQTNPRHEGNGDMVVELRIEKIIDKKNYREIHFGMSNGLGNL